MKICFVSSMHPPLDKRVFEKEAKALAAAGPDVVHLAPDDGLDRELDGVHIRTYRKPCGLRERLFALPALYRRARAIDADVYHCNELDSFVVGVALRRLARRKCVLDVHEFFAHDFAETHCPAWLSPLVRRAMALLIRLLSHHAHAVVLANAALRHDYRHLPAGRIFLVENFGSAASLGATPRTDRREPPFRIVHLGFFGYSRGAAKILDALSLARRKDVEIFCVGSFTGESEAAFRVAARRHHLEDRVHLVPWLPQAEAMALLRTADIGLILFQPGLYAHIHALPHKLFDYMGAELAVIAPEISLRIGEIVTEAQCGVLVDSTSPAAIANAIDRLCGDADALQRLGASGREAVVRRYNWECEARTLVSLYESLATAP
jgi:glycosyltransferase involved in cell wall biosynthesis